MAMKYLKELELFQIRVYVVVGREDLARAGRRLKVSTDPREHLEELGNPPGMTVFDPDSQAIILYLSDENDWPDKLSYGLAAHEAIHVLEYIRAYTNDDEMSEETKAYIVGFVAGEAIQLAQKRLSASLGREETKKPKPETKD